MMFSFSNYLLNFFQVQEERNIAKAIEQQRNLDIQLAEDQLTRKIKEIAEESDLKIEKKVFFRFNFFDFFLGTFHIWAQLHICRFFFILDEMYNFSFK